MKINVEESSSYERVLTIEVPSDKVSAEVEDIYREIEKTATHPGFRKGKVPRRILEGKYAKKVRQEAVDKTIASSVREALDEQKLSPLTEPVLGDVDFGEEGPLSFKVTIEVQPTIELSEYKGIELKRPKKEITDEDVAKILERLQMNHAKFVPVERAVETGDFVVFDFEAFEGGKPLKEGKGENFSLEVGSGYFGEDFENQLVGMEKDEEKRITVTYPDDYKSEDLAGKTLEFDVKIKDVKLRELPALDDDFARDLGDHETLEELKQHWRERLEKDLEKRMQDYLREQAISKIVSESNVEVPPRLKAKVAASVFEEHVRNMAQHGTNRQVISEQRDKIVEFAEKEAERRLKVSFITDEIAERENLNVSDEELEKSLEEMAEESEGGGPDIREYFRQESMRERYRDQLRARKILDFIVGGATIEDVDEAQADSENPELEEEKEGDS